jgi:hypothetical protein
MVGFTGSIGIGHAEQLEGRNIMNHKSDEFLKLKVILQVE